MVAPGAVTAKSLDVNRQLEVDAAEIRMRAERRLGELIRAQKETVGLAKGTLVQSTYFDSEFPSLRYIHN